MHGARGHARGLKLATGGGVGRLLLRLCGDSTVAPALARASGVLGAQAVARTHDFDVYITVDSKVMEDESWQVQRLPALAARSRYGQV